MPSFMEARVVLLAKLVEADITIRPLLNEDGVAVCRLTLQETDVFATAKMRAHAQRRKSDWEAVHVGDGATRKPSAAAGGTRSRREETAGRVSLTPLSRRPQRRNARLIAD
jgi:hypothetical protein